MPERTCRRLIERLTDEPDSEDTFSIERRLP